MPQPREMVERVTAARSFRAALNASSPMYIDGMNNEAMKAYVAWPERLFVIYDGHCRMLATLVLKGTTCWSLRPTLRDTLMTTRRTRRTLRASFAMSSTRRPRIKRERTVLVGRTHRLPA